MLAEDTTGSAPATGTVGKAISLLECVVMAEEPLRFTDILELTGQPRATLHRQLSHLVEEGLLEQGSNQTYVAGLRLLKLASRAWGSNDLRSVAAPHLKHLHEMTQESVHLGVLRGAEVIYLDKIDGKHAVRMYSQIGRTSPVYCTGVGKAALSILPDQQLAHTISRLEFKAFTGSTITTPDALAAEIEIIRARGYSLDLEEHETGIHCVAVPLVTGRQDLLAAISVTGPAYRLTRGELEHWSPLLQKVAAAISADIDHRLPPTG